MDGGGPLPPTEDVDRDREDADLLRARACGTCGWSTRSRGRLKVFSLTLAGRGWGLPPSHRDAARVRVEPFEAIERDLLGSSGRTSRPPSRVPGRPRPRP